MAWNKMVREIKKELADEYTNRSTSKSTFIPKITTQDKESIAFSLVVCEENGNQVMDFDPLVLPLLARRVCPCGTLS
ncbi:cytokinin-regulated kinase precursor [Corchorus olitorius]|uniref:Cytokinin-regulated kinase n=1 Tax=Corchorus olitorius TaxID=93759 RepID=A0A1R3HHT1_9ROSI|nr:cytokinin-regulated kinase precursor [Corchorus olitorius]